jgi:hypothetical protein
LAQQGGVIIQANLRSTDDYMVIVVAQVWRGSTRALRLPGSKPKIVCYLSQGDACSLVARPRWLVCRQQVKQWVRRKNMNIGIHNADSRLNLLRQAASHPNAQLATAGCIIDPAQDHLPWAAAGRLLRCQKQSLDEPKDLFISKRPHVWHEPVGIRRSATGGHLSLDRRNAEELLILLYSL